MPYERTFSIRRRHRQLISLIRTGRFSTPSIAKKLSVSPQTVYRDITFLKDRGYAIQSVKHCQTWAYEFVAEPAKAVNAQGLSGA